MIYDRPVGQSGHAVGISKNVHPKNVAVQTCDHRAKAVGETTDLTCAIDIDGTVDVALEDGEGAVA